MFSCKSLINTFEYTQKVSAAPYWDFEPPSDIDQAEESTAELHCIASGSPTPIIQWYMNGKPLHGDSLIPHFHTFNKISNYHSKIKFICFHRFAFMQ